MPPPPQPCSPAGGQCGGFKDSVKWTGPTCCVDGSECTEKNQWYKQCVPECAFPGAQCGGSAWQGTSCCKFGYKCMKKNKWYYQCRPPWLASLAPAVISRPLHSASDGGDDDNTDEGRAQTTAEPVKCAQDHRQCGGERWKGASCCVSPYTCERKNRWYSQCRTGPFRIEQPTLTNAPDAEGSDSQNADVCAEESQQCGGADWKGASCCRNGLQCEEKNSWFSSCKRPTGPSAFS